MEPMTVWNHVTFHDATVCSTLRDVKRTDTSDWPCTIARSAAVLGDHWNLLLIREACLGTRRFDDFQEALGIGRNILTRRLNGLVDEGLLRRVEYQQNPLPLRVPPNTDAWRPATRPRRRLKAVTGRDRISAARDAVVRA